MPNPEESCDGLSTIFKDNIYKTHAAPWKMIAAINGAHTLGSATIANSGYSGFWSSSKRQGQFTNDYYNSLLLSGWGPETGIGGNSKKNQWRMLDDIEASDHKQMMLNTDMCMMYKNNRNDDDDTGGGKTLNALNGECCAWSELELFYEE
jgi:hypothetical protein